MTPGGTVITAVRRVLMGVLIAALAALGTVAVQTPASARSASDRTSATEARRVDRVPTPKIAWFDCSMVTPRAQCGTVRLPLDYDHPKGATTEVALLRIRAAKPKQRIGTLFVNPGGPGGSGVEFAAAAPQFLGSDLLSRFDIVGFDPRGVNFSDNVRCWRNFSAQSKALAGMDVAFPYTAKQTKAYVGSAVAFGRACSTTGRPLSAHMSTADVARDMDVLRRALGDRALSYLGFSYGTYLGQVYANLFPDRVRALVIDGVLDPIGWAGTGSDATRVPQTQRIKSGEGADKALKEILRRCRAKGPKFCQLAGQGNPATLYAKIVAALKKRPLTITDPDTGEVWATITYQDLVAQLLGDLYYPDAGSLVDADLTDVWISLHSQAAPHATGASSAAARRAAAGLHSRLAVRAAAPDPARTALRKAAVQAGWAFPYDNSPEAFQTVTCTDSRNPRSAADWARYAANADKTASGFGRLWTWSSAPCASASWTVRDTDAYRGPFTRRTANPVLVVGDYWDPATNYAGAVKAASLLPNSRLLPSDSWGHTAYGTSECVTVAVDTYLLKVKLPARGTRCYGDVQPFTKRLGAAGFGVQQRSLPQRPLPPVVPPLPGSTPRR